MARSLPLSLAVHDDVSVASSVNDTPSAHTLQGTVAVFDPALCCATGVCGPGVDPALLAIARDLRWLEANGVSVARVGLSQEPQAFVAQPTVSALMRTAGDGALPAVLVNGTVLCYGRYPTREELVGALTPSVLPTATP